MNEQEADAASIRELLVENISKGDMAMARHNLGNLLQTFSHKIQPGRPEYKTGSRSSSPELMHPLAELYQQVLKCLSHLDALLNQPDAKEEALAKANEAARILQPQPQHHG